MRKMTTFYEYKGETRTGKKIRLYYIDGTVQNQGAWAELMAVTDQKQDYRAERFTYSGGTYPEYVNRLHPVVKVVHEVQGLSAKPMTATEILEMCNRKPTQAQTLGEDGTIVKARRGRPRKDKVAPPVTLDAEGNVVKRKRGRPRKNPLPVSPALAA